MAIKRFDYFDKLVEMAAYSTQAASFLLDNISDFKYDGIDEIVQKMHEIEHSADILNHEIMSKLAKEFITPIEREDIIALARGIDTVTDKIETVLQRIYMYNITVIRDEVIQFVKVIVKCTQAMEEALKELHNFKKSKVIKERLILINTLEEDGDKLYIDSVRKLYTEEHTEANYTGAWTITFDYLEKCCDACEEVADTIETIIMKNS
ncbi:MAG: DUF47 domain-containing protein [Lachnospiraceae bacterium]